MCQNNKPKDDCTETVYVVQEYGSGYTRVPVKVPKSQTQNTSASLSKPKDKK